MINKVNRIAKFTIKSKGHNEYLSVYKEKVNTYLSNVRYRDSAMYDELEEVMRKIVQFQEGFAKCDSRKDIDEVIESFNFCYMGLCYIKANPDDEHKFTATFYNVESGVMSNERFESIVNDFSSAVIAMNKASDAFYRSKTSSSLLSLYTNLCSVGNMKGLSNDEARKKSMRLEENEFKANKIIKIIWTTYLRMRRTHPFVELFSTSLEEFVNNHASISLSKYRDFKELKTAMEFNIFRANELISALDVIANDADVTIWNEMIRDVDAELDGGFK